MNQLKVLFVVWLLFCAAGWKNVSADTFKPAPLFPTNAVHAKELSNGVHTIVRTTPGSGVVNLQVWAEAGSRYETDTNNGVTHIIEMLAMQGSKNHPTETDGRLSGPQPSLEALGAQVASYTSRDDVFWSVTLASSSLSQAAKIMADAVLHPDLSDPSVAAAKTIAASDWMQSRVDPMEYTSDLAYQEAFAKHPYRKPAKGDLTSLNQLNGDNVREYYQRRFTGSHLHVVVVGDVDAVATLQLLESTFGDAPKTQVSDNAIPTATPITTSRRITKRGMLPIQVETLAWHSPAISSPKDAVVADVILTYLNEGSDAKLRQILMNGATDEEVNQSDSAMLAGGFSVDYLTQHDAGLFLINIVAPTKPLQAVVAVRNVMDDLGSGLPAADLQRAKTLLRRQYVDQSSNAAGQAGALGFYDTIDSYQFAIDYLDHVEQITSEDIAQVAKKYFRADNYVQVTLLPALGNPQQQNNDTGIIASLGLMEPRA